MIKECGLVLSISLISFRILLELQGNDEPLWTYFDSQHKHIIEQMNKSYQNAKAVVQSKYISSSPLCHPLIFIVAELNKTKADPDSTLLLATQLRLAVLGLENKQPEANFGTPSAPYNSYQLTPMLTKTFSQIRR